jgi:sugar O-acyltransferase (sialic acid O-acetyltransferase NeuD family)
VESGFKNKAKKGEGNRAFFLFRKTGTFGQRKNMLIAGAKGFAKQLLDVIFQLERQEGLVFYDDYDPAVTSLFDFRVLKTQDAASEHFRQNSPEFALGLGNPRVRHQMKLRLEAAGGNCISLISPLARIAQFTKIGKGTCIMTSAVVENDTILGEGCLINLSALVCHDCRVGNFVEISPGAILTGACSVGDFSFIGSGAVLKPGVKIGHHAVVAAGAVVIENVPDNVMVAGVPAKIKKIVEEG